MRKSVGQRIPEKEIANFQLVELLKNQDLLEELTKVKYEEEYLCQKSTQKEKILLNL